MERVQGGGVEGMEEPWGRKDVGSEVLLPRAPDYYHFMSAKEREVVSLSASVYKTFRKDPACFTCPCLMAMPRPH